MPVMNGLEATTEIRRRETDRRIPIVALTANALRGDRERCIAAGMDDFLVKPVQKERLLSVLGRVCELAQSAPTMESEAA
jgi:CheY-like chemotaxis protein